MDCQRKEIRSCDEIEAFRLSLHVDNLICEPTVINFSFMAHLLFKFVNEPILVIWITVVKHRRVSNTVCDAMQHDDVIKWKHFPRYWPFVREIHRSTVNSSYKGQWRGALMFSLIWARINRLVNNREAGDLRRYRAHFDVIVMVYLNPNLT